MVSMIDSAIQHSQIMLTRLTKWKNKIDFQIEVGPYSLQIARDRKQVLECFKLRHQVFCIEMGAQAKAIGLDYDRFDNYCDHLIIFHKPTEKIVGTYRLNFSDTASEFYTATEFDLHDWLKQQQSPFVELGRACIEKNHRRGIVITLLWRGLAEYMKAMNAEKLIGCSSLKVTDARSAALVFKYLEQNGFLTTELLRPLNKYEMKDFYFWHMMFSKGLTEEQSVEAKEKVPSLLSAYLKAGAKVASFPAYDEEFKCIDFVTILSQNELSPRLVKKFIES